MWSEYANIKMTKDKYIYTESEWSDEVLMWEFPEDSSTPQWFVL